jgi:hypothetical protein
MRILVTLGILLLAMQTARAQSEGRECPGLESGASAEQQALCWFERDQRGAADECAAVKDGISTCTRQTASWCAEAAFDNASVADACFLSHLRAGQLDEALSIERYLQTPTGEVAKCQQTLKSVTVKFVSVPAGAEILVDGHSYGKAPVEVELRGQWWKSAALARFGADDGVTETEVSRQDLIAAFDRRACAMAEVVVKGSEAAAPFTPSILAPQTIADEASTKTPTDKQTKISVPAVVAIAVGGAGIITGGVLLAIAVSRVSDLQSPRDGTPWNEDLKNKNNSLKPLRIGGGVALGAGAALAAVGVVLLTMAGGSSPENAAEKASQTLRLAGQGIQWTGGF